MRSRSYSRIAGACFIFLILFSCCVIPVQAATGVPDEVITATDSVVFITLASDAEKTYSEDEREYLKENYSEYLFRSGNSDYVIESSGSGFVIKAEDTETLIATNNHVIEDDHKGIFVWVTDKKAVHAEVVFSIPEKDLSVIRVKDSINKEPAELAEVDASRGEAVYAVGFPGAGNVLSDSLARTSDEATITDGIISAVRSYTAVDGGDSAKILQINAAVNSGNSGGPLFNTEGKVIGVNTYSIEGGTQGVFGAVAVSELHALLKAYGIEISEETSAQVKTRPLERKFSSGKLVKYVLLIAICVALGTVSLLVLSAAFRRKTLAAGEPEVEKRFDPEPSVEANPMTGGKDVDLDGIVITKRRVRSHNYVDVNVVTMTHKGREKKDNSEPVFTPPDKLEDSARK